MPKIVINGGSPGVKASVSASGAISATLDTVDGIRTVEWSISGTDETKSPSDYTLVQSGSVGQNVSTTAKTLGTAAILRARWNGGIDLQTGLADPVGTQATCKFYVPTAGDLEVGCTGETTESSAEHGSTGIINQAVRGVSGSAVQGLTGNDPIDVDSADPAHPVVKWAPTANVGMSAHGFTSCTGLSYGTGSVAVTAGVGALTLDGPEVDVGPTTATLVKIGRSGQTVRLPALAGGGTQGLAVDNSGNITTGGSGADANAHYWEDASTAVNTNGVATQNLAASLAVTGQSGVVPIKLSTVGVQASDTEVLRLRRTVSDASGHGGTSTIAHVAMALPNATGTETEFAEIAWQLTSTLGPSGKMVLRTLNSGTMSDWLTLGNAGDVRLHGASYAHNGYRLVLDGSGNVSASIITPAEVITALSTAASAVNINSQDLSGVGNLNVGGDAVISGNLTVSGTTTTVNSTAVSLADRLVVFNSSTGTVPVPVNIAGFVIDRGSADGVTKRDAAGVFWDEGNTRFDFAYNTTLDQTTVGTFIAVKVGGLTISGFGSGILHSSGAGVVTSSPVVNSDVASGAAIDGTKILPDFGSQNVTTTGSITAGTSGFIGPQINRASSGTFTFGANITTAAFSSAALTGVASVANASGALALSAGSGAASLDSDSSHHTQVGASTAQAVDIGNGTITITLTGLTDSIYAGIAAVKTTGRSLRNTTAATSGVTVQYAPSDVWEGHAWISSSNKTLRARKTLIPKTSSNLDILTEYDTGGGSYSTAWYYTTATPSQFLAAVVCSGFAATQGTSGFFFDTNDSGLQLTGSNGLTLVSYESADSLRLRGEATGSTDPVRVWASGETKGSSKAIVAFGDGSTWAQRARIAGDGVYEGPLGRPTGLKTADYTAAFWDIVRCSLGGGGFTVKLPDPASTDAGKSIWIKNEGSSTNTLTLTTVTGSVSIDDASSKSISGAWFALEVKCTGTNGYIMFPHY